MASNSKPSAPYAQLISVSILPDGRTLTFSDGFTYAFRDVELLNEARRVFYLPPGANPAVYPDFNRHLAGVGDAMMKAICKSQWYKNGDRSQAWEERFNKGIAMNSFLTHMAKETGVEDFIMLKDGEPGSSCRVGLVRKDSADTMEAIIGAVWEDSGDMATTKEVMMRLGVHYPERGDDANNMDQWLDVKRRLGVIG